MNDKTHLQFNKLLPIWIIFSALILQAFLRNSSAVHITNCSFLYWVVYIIYVAGCLGGVSYAVFTLKKEIALKERINFPSYRGEVKFTLKKITVICGVSVMAGIIAAIVGIGGGVIFLPLLLVIGYPPLVASNTSALMVMYSSTGNFLSYTIAGRMILGWGFWLGGWVVLGVIFAVTVANRIVQKTGRQSVIIFMLAAVLILGVIFSVIFNTIDTIKEIKDGENIFEFGNVGDS